MLPDPDTARPRDDVTTLANLGPHKRPDVESWGVPQTPPKHVTQILCNSMVAAIHYVSS